MLRNTQPPTVPPTMAPMLGLLEPEGAARPVGLEAGGAVTVTVLGPGVLVGVEEPALKVRGAVDVKAEESQPCWVIVVRGYTNSHL